MEKTTARKRSASKRGRPVSAYGAKKNRSLYLSDPAYEVLQELAKKYEMSLSELMEKIGHQELLVVDQLVETPKEPFFDDFPIVQKLQTFIDKPNGALCSTLAFVTKLSGQLGLPQTPDFLQGVVLDAMRILFCLSYLYPDQHIDSPTAWLRWYVLHILEARVREAPHLVEQASQRIRYQTEENLTRKCIATIAYARKELTKQDNVTHLYALKLRMWPHELSISQIERVCKAQDVSIPGFELVSRGMTTFRRLWLQDDDIHSNISEKERKTLREAEQYCTLLREPSLKPEDIETLKRLIKRGLDFPDHDFWANEIDFFLGCRTCENHDRYEQDAKELQLLIQKKLEPAITRKKCKLDRELLNKDRAKEVANLLCQETAQYLGFSPHDYVKEAVTIRLIVNPIARKLPARGNSQHLTLDIEKAALQQRPSISN